MRYEITVKDRKEGTISVFDVEYATVNYDLGVEKFPGKLGLENRHTGDARLSIKGWNEPKRKSGDFPRYVKLGDTALRYLNMGDYKRGRGGYFRDAGHWAIDARLEGEKVFAVAKDEMAHVDGMELIPITEEEWRESNKGYV